MSIEVKTVPYDKENDALRERVTELTQRLVIAESRMSKWISVKDKLPSEFDEVIFAFTLTDTDAREITIGHLANGIWHSCFLYESRKLGHLIEVTHWQHLPEPPK